MKMIPDAKTVALKSYSMWANYCGIVAIMAPDAIYLSTGRDTSPHMWLAIGLGLIIAGIAGRLVSQGIAR
jgi:hypothetical protein